MIKTICYISDASKDESLENLNILYKKAKANNQKNNITGVLIYKNKNFLQVLEGEEDQVNKTYSRITQDPRHKNLFKVIDTALEQRIFDDYHFGFTLVNNKKSLQNLYDYLEWLRNANSTSINKVVAMVENFILRK